MRQLTEDTDVLTLKLLFKKWLHYFLRYKNELRRPPTWIPQYSVLDGEIREGGTVLVIDAHNHTYSIDMLVFL